MKNILFTLTLLLGISAFSQGLTLGKSPSQELKYENGKFYKEGKQISSRETKVLLESDLHALQLFNSAKSKETLGSTLLGLGITMTVVDLAIGLFSDAKYPTALTYAGLSSIVISIPILSGRAKRMKEAIESYNNSIKNSSVFDGNFDMNAMVNQNGVGIQINF